MKAVHSHRLPRASSSASSFLNPIEVGGRLCAPLQDGTYADAPESVPPLHAQTALIRPQRESGMLPIHLPTARCTQKWTTTSPWRTFACIALRDAFVSCIRSPFMTAQPLRSLARKPPPSVLQKCRQPGKARQTAPCHARTAVPLKPPRSAP